MTVSVRNGLLALAFSVLLLALLGYGFLAVALISTEGWTASIGPVPLLWLLTESLGALAVSLVGFILMRRTHRRASAPEFFFFALFFGALAGETLLVVQAWLHFVGAPAWYSSTLTRVVWACRFSGLFLLFCGSLFAFDFSYRKYGNLVVTSLVAAALLATALPLHTTWARNHLLFAMGDAPGVVLFNLVLVLVIAANYLVGAWRPGAAERAKLRAGAALFFLGGWALAIVTAPWGVVLVVPGIVLARWRAEQNPEWG